MDVRGWMAAAVVLQAWASPLVAQATSLGEVEILGEGPATLLVIPCASCRWRSFGEFAERNADRFTTVAVTLPGYGGSALPALPEFGPDPVWHDHAVSALEGLLAELGGRFSEHAVHVVGTAVPPDRRPPRDVDVPGAVVTAFSMDYVDLSGDGRLDIVLTEAFHTLVWLEQPERAEQDAPYDGVLWLEQVRSPDPRRSFEGACATDSPEQALPPRSRAGEGGSDDRKTRSLER